MKLSSKHDQSIKGETIGGPLARSLPTVQSRRLFIRPPIRQSVVRLNAPPVRC